MITWDAVVSDCAGGSEPFLFYRIYEFQTVETGLQPVWNLLGSTVNTTFSVANPPIDSASFYTVEATDSSGNNSEDCYG